MCGVWGPSLEGMEEGGMQRGYKTEGFVGVGE